MVTCGRQPFNMLPMAPINPFVVGLTPSSMAAAAAAAAAVADSTARSIGSTSTATTTMITANASATATTASIRPKLAFSIDSIVGINNNNNNNNIKDVGRDNIAATHCRPMRSSVISPPLSSSQRSESPDDRLNGSERDRLLHIYDRPPSRVSLSHSEDSHHCQQPLELRNSFTVNYRPINSAADVHPTQLTRPTMGLIYCRRRSLLNASPERDSGSPTLVGRCTSRSRSRSPNRPIALSARELTNVGNRSRTPTPSPPPPSNSRTTPQSPQTPSSASTSIGSELSKRPIHVPGIPAGLIRPLPLQAPQSLSILQAGGGNGGGAPSSLDAANPAANATSLHPIATAIQGSAPPPLPTTLSIPPPHPANTGVVAPPPPPPNPHFLAAQFQMAAALAHHHHQQQQHNIIHQRICHQLSALSVAVESTWADIPASISR
ncbi:unnamed protein product [Ceratitis capitata]|uniref:(Mediterranean fruit fly) hypothetical protein n=1 Tax=Ceratitis capitata TaxID=7213 RepID=A0A811UAZ1_CERCA|nr:unnamed protein product [Ceratitis capitata]